MISVVIPAYNEENTIAACLESFCRQTIREEPFEIILVNNNSTDQTVTIAQKFSQKLRLHIISEKKQGRGAARRAGFAKASGNIILSTDADVRVPPEWIKQMNQELTDSEAVAVSGSCYITDQSRWENTLFNALMLLGMHLYRFVYGYYWLSGFNFGIKSEVYRQSIGFDANLNAQEDIDISIKISKLGSIRYLKNLPVEVSGRRLKNGLVLGLFSYVYTFTKYKLKRQDVYLDDIR